MTKLFLLLSAIVLVSCAKGSGGGGGSEDTVIVVHGDPMAIVAGTELHPEASIPDSFFAPGSGYHVFTTYFLKWSRQKKDRTWEQVKNQNSAASSGEANSFFDRSFYKLDSIVSNGETFPVLTNTARGRTFIFKKDGGLRIHALFENSLRYDVGIDWEVLHSSFNYKKGAFSVLIREKVGKSETLISYTFLKPKPNDAKSDGSSFFYIFDKGVPTRWQGTFLDLKFCGTEGESRYETLVTESVQAWNQALKDRFVIGLNAKKCLPFSDVNESGVYLIDAYLKTGIGKFRTTGTTLITYDNGGEIIGSDILLWRSEIHGNQAGKEELKNAYKNERERLQRKNTIVHELGHLLGLDHNMDDDQSIMSYDYEGEKLGRYDVEAIQHLYSISSSQ